MPVPPQVNVLWTFRPTVVADWDGQIIDEWATGGGSITGAFAFNCWAFADYTQDVKLYKDTAISVGCINRLKCTFNLSELPDSGEKVNIAVYDDPDITIDEDGHLRIGYNSAIVSTNAIAPGVTYELEFYIKFDLVADTQLWQIYINGDLWVEEDPGYGWNYDGDALWLAVGFAGGAAYQSPWPAGPQRSINLSMTDIVWTMEDLQVAPGRWTMLALL